MGYVLGIDLGTTYTAAAVWRDGVTEVATLGVRAAAIPTVVLVRDPDPPLVGEPAEERARHDPSRVARAFKRRVGDPTPIVLDGRPYSAEALMARVLGWVVGLVSEREGGPPDRISVTHPANWGPYKLEQLQQAVRLAEIGPVDLVPEPVAAAVAYAHQRDIPEGSTVAVYDLGGGTFDATVLRRQDGEFRVLGTPEGVEHLGGLDVDAAVVDHVVRSALSRPPDLDEEDVAAQMAFARLRDDCTRAKELLSSDTDVAIPVLLPAVSTEVRLTRIELERMIEPLIDQTIAAMHRAIASSGVAVEEIGAVLLVGGSSRIPLIAQKVGSELGRPVAVDVHPKHAVAVGAAQLAAGDLGEVSAVRGSVLAAPPPPPVPDPATSALPEPPPAPEPPAPPRSPARVGAGTPVPPTPPPPAAARRRSGDNRRRVFSAFGALGLVVAAVGGGYLAMRSDTAGTDPGAEVFAEPVASVGIDPFTPSVGADAASGGLAEALEPPEGSGVGVDLPAIELPGSSGATPTVSGGAPGLYGGSNRIDVCDRAQLVAFLEQNPDKGAAWAAVHGIEPSEIPAFVAGLTDVILQADTRVTNHGFRDGRATPHQSVLQAGTAVLVDRFGVPRVRCKCGNPLTAPTALSTRAPTIRGTTWPEFGLERTVAVAPSDSPIEEFQLDDLESDGIVLRAAGSEASTATVVPAGGESASTTTAPATTTSSTSTTTSLPPPENVTALGDLVGASSTFSSEFPARLSVDGDTGTSWFSAGSQVESTSVFGWSAPVPVHITEIRIIGNGEHDTIDFRRGFGFEQVDVVVRGEDGQVTFQQSFSLEGSPDPTVSVQPGVAGTDIELRFRGHEDPTCGGFSELIVTGSPLA